MRYLLILALLTITIATSFAHQSQIILFSSDRDGDFEIYSMTADGKDINQITDNSIDDRYPVLSPQGIIAYITKAEGKDDIFTIDLTSGNKRRLTTLGTNRYPSFSPDGMHLLFISDRDGDFEIYRMNLDGSGQKQITDNSFEDRAPSYSPDGQTIVFCSNRNGEYEIFEMKADGQDQKSIFAGGHSWSPRFSPDGKLITFYSNKLGAYEIWLMDHNGKNARKLTEDDGASYPCFSPDGSSIVYSSYQGDTPQIHLLDLQTGKSTQLHKSDADDMTPRWATYAGP